MRNPTVKSVFKSIHNHRRYLHFCDRDVCAIKYAATQRLQLRAWPILCTGLRHVQLFLVIITIALFWHNLCVNECPVHNGGNVFLWYATSGGGRITRTFCGRTSGDDEASHLKGSDTDEGVHWAIWVVSSYSEPWHQRIHQVVFPAFDFLCLLIYIQLNWSSFQSFTRSSFIISLNFWTLNYFFTANTQTTLLISLVISLLIKLSLNR